MLPTLSVIHKRKTIFEESVVEALPPLIPVPAREILHCTCKLLRSLPVTPILDEKACDGDALEGTKEADLVEELGASLEGDEEVRVSVGLDEGVAMECEEGKERR